jgi:hypothetical protein
MAFAMSASVIDFVVCNEGELSLLLLWRKPEHTLKAILSRKWLTPELDGVSYRAPVST